MHFAAPFIGHAAPAAAVPPLAQVHCLVAHCRFCVLLGATVWYCAAVHVAEAVAFGAEYFLYGSGGEPFIVFMVMLNAVLFTAVAARGV